MGRGARWFAFLGGAALGLGALSRAGARGRREAAAPRTAGRVLSGGRDAAVRATLVALASPRPGERVLDAGCGTGTLALALAAGTGAGMVEGIDASPAMIAVARAKAARGRAGVAFRVALVEALPFPAATFDLVTSSLMLHHLPADLQRAALGEVRRVLKPGGRFLALDFAVQDHSHLGPGRPIGHLLSVVGRPRGERTVDTLPPLLADAGFGDVETIPTRHERFAFVRARRSPP